MKKDFTESGYIEDAMTRIALIHPEIAIKLINTGKTIIQTSGSGDLKSVVYGIYGKEIAENLLNVNYEYEDIKVTGVIGKPSIARSNRSNQLFFVNKRYVKDKSLTSSAEQAYKGMITIGKFGFLILNIEVDPHKVDVNVHPAKLEVRFSEEQNVFKAVYHAIKDTLLQGEFIGRSEERATLDVAETKITPRMEEVKVVSIYEKIEEFGIGKKNLLPAKVFLPCPDREKKELLGEIEQYIEGKLTPIEEVQCCGLGGCAPVKEPELAKNMGAALKNSGGQKIYSYCASCAGNLNRNGCKNVTHILTEILETDEKADTGKSMLNRMKTKFI